MRTSWPSVSSGRYAPVNSVWTKKFRAGRIASCAGSWHQRRMGRKMLYPERTELPLAAGTTARIDAVRHEGETRLDLIRTALDLELARRGAPKAPPDAPQPQTASGTAQRMAKGKAKGGA